MEVWDKEMGMGVGNTEMYKSESRVKVRLEFGLKILDMRDKGS